MPIHSHVQEREEGQNDLPPTTLRFPIEDVRNSSFTDSTLASEDVLDALENVSRRIDDLARELNCLGWFNDDDDRPRAA